MTNEEMIKVITEMLRNNSKLTKTVYLLLSGIKDGNIESGHKVDTK